MTGSVMWLVILGTMVMAANNLIKRSALKDRRLSPLQGLIFSMGIGAVCLAFFYVINWGASKPQNLLPKFWQAVFGGMSANLFIQFLNAKAASLDKGEASLTAPLQAMTPFLITMVALLLGEFPGPIGYAGIGCMICGSYVLLWEKEPKHWTDYFGPLRRLRLLFHLKHLTPEEKNKTIVVSLALTSALLGTVGLLFDGLFTRRSVDLQGLSLGILTLFVGLTTCYAIWYLIKPDSTIEQRKYFFRSTLDWQYFKWPFLWGLCLSASWLLVSQGYYNNYVAYVGTMKRLNILFTVILGHFLLKEIEFKKRLWAAVLIIAGAILITADGLPEKVSTTITGLGL